MTESTAPNEPADDAPRATSAEPFRMLAESIPQLAWIAHADGSIFWYNQRWYEYTGTTPEEMQGWGWQSVHHPDYLPDVLARWKASIASGEPFDMEFPLRAADGSFRWFLTRVQPVRDAAGRVDRWFGTNTDIDERRRAADFLEQARSEAEAASRAKSAFLAHMSHELRTPINAINGYAELLQLGVNGPLNEKQLEHVRRVQTSSAHLLALVNDVLDMTKIEADAMDVHIAPHPLPELLDEAIQLIEPVAVARGARIETDIRVADDLILAVDRDRTRQILANLLSNAVKFGPPGESVRIEARIAAPEETPPRLVGRRLVRIAVQDRGIGIEPQHHDRIFEPFFQVDSGYTRAGGGTGLGLTISRRLARAMDGDITVESKPGSGATFAVWLPAA